MPRSSAARWPAPAIPDGAGTGPARPLGLSSRVRVLLVRSIGVLVFCLSSGLAVAQTVTVTSGEHGTFTRIVLQSPRAFRHTLREEGTELRIRIADIPLSLDRARVFRTIPRTRLSDIMLAGDTLVLARPCACPARIFIDRPGVLVIDLSDPIDDAGSTVAGNGEVPGPPEPLDPGSGPSFNPGSVGRALGHRLSSVAQELGREPEMPEASDLMSRLSALLASEIARGLVSPQQPAPSPRALGARGWPPVPDDLPANLRLRDAGRTPDQPTESPHAAVACPEPHHLAFLNLPAADDAFGHISRLRADMFGEFDRVDPDVARSLAQHYLSWALGAEARALIEMAPFDTAEGDLLGGIADLIEDVASNRRARLLALRDCAAPAGLLAVLVAPAGGGARLDGDALVTGFLELPPALRAAFGPDLVRRLIDAGAIDGARIVFDAIQRAHDRPDDGVMIRLAAEIDRARGDLSLARDRIAHAAPDDLAALLLRLDLDLARGVHAPIAALEDAVALAEADRTGATGRAVILLVVRHHDAAGRVAEGLRLLDRYVNWLGAALGRGDDDVDNLRRALWTTAVALPDVDLLELLLSRDDWRAVAIDPSIREPLIERLRALGLQGLIVDLAAAEPGRRDGQRGGDFAGAVTSSAELPGTPVAERVLTGLSNEAALPRAPAEEAGSPVIGSDRGPGDAVGSAPAPATMSGAADRLPILPDLRADPAPGSGPDNPMTRGLQAIDATDRLRRELRALGLSR